MSRRYFVCLLTVIVTVMAISSCRNGGQRECSSIEVTSPVKGPAEDTSTLCVTATQCREDVMAGLIAQSLCKKSGNPCEPGDKSCAINQLCRIKAADDSGVIVTSVSWNRDKPCKEPAGTNECTAKWKINAGSSLHCECGCAR
jgi:hypothetical protein